MDQRQIDYLEGGGALLSTRIRECLAIKNNRKLSTVIGVFFLLFVGSPAASATPEDNKTVSQNSVVKTSPDTLYYDNMLVGIPKSATLTISNVSGDNITVQPFIDFGPEYSKFLNYSLELCEFEKCTPVTKTTKTDIYKDESKKLNLTITLTSDLPNNLPSVSINQGLQITGEVHTPKEDINIIPKIEEKETPLADTGVSSNLFTIMGIGGVLLMVGCGLFAAAKRKKTDPESNEEYKEN